MEGRNAEAERRRRSPKDAGASKRRRGGGRSRARISASGCKAGFHETSMAFFRMSLRRRKDVPNRRRPRESPRDPSRQGGGQGFGSSRDPSGMGRGFGLDRFREESEGFGPSAFPRGDRKGFGPDASPGDGPASAGSDPPREAAAGRKSRSSDPTGIGEGPHGLSRDPPGTERGLWPRCGIRGDRPGREPRRDPEAAQREMASPPSDGSQSWDKWGPVATPAPIMIPPVADRTAAVGRPAPELRQLSRRPGGSAPRTSSPGRAADFGALILRAIVP
jgi:hypothetical protein